MPTLRLDRRDNPESLRGKVEHALQQKSTSVAPSMLRGKQSGTRRRWNVPIVLDLAALVPDGSPHYKKPTQGLLIGVVDTLDVFGIRVVGVTNTPKELEQEAIETLGLPSLMAKSTLQNSSSTVKVRLDDVVQMVLTKQQQEPMVRPEPEAQRITPDETVQTTPSKVETPVNDDASSSTTVEKSEDTADQPVEIISPVTSSFVYYGTVRSGQQVAADKGQSLVIVGSVSSGGEVLSDTDIYVYGKLRGRALAGLASDDGKIVATSFDPELVCIGDVFTTVHDVTEQFGLDEPGQPAMVSLSKKTSGELEITPIDI